jgi:hypothetical protein
LKETIELDKTLSKYRSDIQNIISGSIIKNRTNPPAPALDIIYTGTTFGNSPVGLSNAHSSSSKNVETVSTLYCPRAAVEPKPARSSFMDVFRSTFARGSSNPSTSSVTVDTDSPYYQLSQIRGGRADLRNRAGRTTASQLDLARPEPVMPQAAAKKAYPTPVKEPSSILAWMSSLYNRRVMPAVSYAGLKLSQLLPYIVFFIFTIIVLEYARVKFINNPTSFFNRMDEEFESRNEQMVTGISFSTTFFPVISGSAEGLEFPGFLTLTLLSIFLACEKYLP